MTSRARTEEPAAGTAAGMSAGSYVDEARSGAPGGWRYVVGLLAILVAWWVVGTVVSLLLTVWFSGSPDVSALGPVPGFVVTMAAFPFFLAGIVLTVTRLHRRRVRTLVTGAARIDRGRVGHGFVVWLLLWGLVTAGHFVLAPETFSVTTDLGAVALFVPLALVLTGIQTTTEELFYRGYVVQAASLIWGNRVFLALVSAVVFTLPHLLNPETGAGSWLTVFFGYFLGTGLVWAAVSLIDGTTELAVGAHFANNIANILLVNTAGTVVTTPALVTVAAYDPLVGAASTLVIVPLFVVAVRWLSRRRSRR